MFLAPHGRIEPGGQAGLELCGRQAGDARVVGDIARALAQIRDGRLWSCPSKTM